MKQVYTNSELCKVFANQSQDYGKNSNGSLFFEGNKIYSYGYHFCIANLVNDIAYINNGRYSVTTSVHQSQVANALNNGTIYYIDNPEHPDSEPNFLDVGIRFEELFKKHKRAKVYSYTSELSALLATLEHLLINYHQNNEQFQDIVKKFRTDLKAINEKAVV